MAFTAFPIGWYSCFDYEYTKDVLLRRPFLYKIGMENKYFNKYVFWRWCTFALW